jgi:hypothetical protein
MFLRTKTEKSIRPARGSGIVEGLVGMMLISGATVLTVILILNSAIASYDREKIGFVANQTAYYAASLDDPSTRDSDATAFADNLLTQMGLQASNTTAKVSDTAAGPFASVSVEVSAKLPTVTSSAFSYMLPSQLQVSDTSMVVKRPYVTQYLQGVDPIGGQVVVPLIEAPTATLPPDSLQAWQIALFGVTQLR